MERTGFGVDAGLVGKGTVSGDVVVEGNIDLDVIGDKIFDILELLQIVLAEDIVAVGNNHARHQTTKRGDSIPLANSEHGSVNVGGTGLESAVGICNSTSGIILSLVNGEFRVNCG